MKNTWTEAKIKQLAAERGGELLSPFLGLDKPHTFRCGKGHQWTIKGLTGFIYSQSWCLGCAGLKPKNIEFLKELAATKGGKCLSSTYVNSKTKYSWECSKGHVWEASVSGRRWCPTCAGKNKTIDDLRGLADKWGGKCLSSTYVNSKTKYSWGCSKGHRWLAAGKDIAAGRWCPTCAGKNKTIKELQEVAEARGGSLVEPLDYRGTKFKYKWRCSKGHEWLAIADGIIGKRREWCLHCAQKAKKSIESLKGLAAAKGGKCLAEFYTNNHTKCPWECSKGHRWEATTNDIQQGQWCPRCSNKGFSRAELRLYEDLKDIYPDAVHNKTKVLVTEPRLRPDIYISSLKLVIEVDGAYWHQNTSRDARKTSACQAQGLKLVRLDWELLDEDYSLSLSDIKAYCASLLG